MARAHQGASRLGASIRADARAPAARQGLSRVLILADDLTGAADCAAAFLGRARNIEVLLDPKARSSAAVASIDLDTRSRPERAARAIVRKAARRRGPILYKKIDSTLRGHISAELAAMRPASPSRPVLFAPAFPAQKRTVRGAKLVVNDRLQAGDLRSLLTAAGYPATHIERGASLRAALEAGARALVCDAETDADLLRLARAGLRLRPRPLFVGSAGLARALARSLPQVKGKPTPSIARRPVVVVVGSASPVSARQALVLSRSHVLSRSDLLLHLVWTREPRLADKPVALRLGRLIAEGMPEAHYVLTGGETARAVLGALGLRRLRLLGEVEPGVPFGMADGGTLVCTKAGGFGSPRTLVRCVAVLKKAMR